MSDKVAVTFRCNGVNSTSLYSHFAGDSLLSLVDQFEMEDGSNTPDPQEKMNKFIAWLNEQDGPKVDTDPVDVMCYHTREYSNEVLFDTGNWVIDLDPTTGKNVLFVNMDDGNVWNHVTYAEEISAIPVEGEGRVVNRNYLEYSMPESVKAAQEKEKEYFKSLK